MNLCMSIPPIIYINLERRPDRKDQIEKELAEYGLIFERFEAIDDSNMGVGCAMSHLEVLKLAKRRGYKSVLILEDEIQRLSIDYDVCMLAYNLIQSTDLHDTPFLRKVLDAQTASAYIVKKHYYDVLIQLYEVCIPLLISTGEHWKYANDQSWKTLQRKDNWICTSTRIGKQKAGFSDNGKTYADYLC